MIRSPHVAFRAVLMGLLVVCLWIQAAPPCLSQPAEPANNRFLTWFVEDTSAWFRSWDGKRVLWSAGGLAILAPLTLADEGFSESAGNWDDPFVTSSLDVTNQMGGLLGAVLPLGVFGVSLASDNARFQEAAFTSLQAVVFANSVNLGVKLLFGRSRPFEGVGAFDFNPFSGNMSFASGHTTTAFALITPWVLYYPNVATYLLFAAASGTALARVHKQRHWLTDVLAGAANGITMAVWLTRRHKADPRAGGLQVDPVVTPEAVGLALRLRL